MSLFIGILVLHNSVGEERLVYIKVDMFIVMSPKALRLVSWFAPSTFYFSFQNVIIFGILDRDELVRRLETNNPMSWNDNLLVTTVTTACVCVRARVRTHMHPVAGSQLKLFVSRVHVALWRSELYRAGCGIF